MRERHVLASCLTDRKAFALVADHVTHEDFSEQGWIVWEGLRDYYDADPGCRSVDSGILTGNITRKVAADKHKDMFANLIEGLSSFETSPANVVADLLTTKRDVLGHRLAAALLAGEDAGGLLTDYNYLLDATTLGEEEVEDARIGLSVEELVGTVLYIGNEDPLDDINMRVVNRLSGMAKMEVINAPNKADRIARENGYENIILKGLSPGTPREITSLIEKYNPHVLVLDQLRNLNMKQDNRVLALEEAATQGRQWAKRYSCVVVSVTQAGDSASGKAVLDMGDVDFSNTGIPSQADVMIGLGANNEHVRNGEIVISLPKNKVSGRHEYFACQVEPHLSKVTSIG
jgi:hypothetical protein